MSPVSLRLISSIGRTWERPPPAAPPFTPKKGPSDGWRSAQIAVFPIRFRPSESPMVLTVLPSPSGVGVIAVTTTILARGGPSDGRTSSRIFALWGP